MYRVLKVSSFSYNSYQAFYPHLPFFHTNNFKCNLCNKIARHQIVGGSVFECSTAFYATRISENLSVSQISRRRNNRRKKNYIELLEVSKDKTSERKARVKTINARSWAKLELIENLSENPEVASSLTNVEHEFDGKILLPEGNEDKEPEDFVDDLALSQKKPRKAKITSDSKRLSRKNKEKLTRNKLELDKSGKEKSFNSSLVSYVELCLNCGFLNRGWFTVLYYLKSKKKLIVNDERVFNILMECCAKNGNYEKLLEIWKTMVETAGIKPSPTSFARRFETIAMSKKKDKSQLFGETMRLMNDHGISCNDIFEKTEWKGDSQKIVLSAIRVVQPQFSPKIQPPDMTYYCPLVNHLNNTPDSLASPAKNMFTQDELNNLFKEQLEMENKIIVKVKSIEKSSECSETTTFCRKALEELEKEWDKSITTGFHKDLVNMFNLQQRLHRSHCPVNIYPYLTVLNKRDYVEIIKHEIRKLGSGSETYSATVSHLCRELGNMVKIRYDIKSKSSYGALKKLEKVYEDYSKWYLNPNLNQYGHNSRHTWQLLISQHSQGPTLDIDSEPWSATTLTAIGRFLYNIILRDVKININIMKPESSKHYLPAFYTLFRYELNASHEEIKPHPVLSRLFKSACSPYLDFAVTDLPMLSPPLPWSSPNSGGYLVARTPLIRLPHSAVLQRERLAERSPNLLYPCLDSLNQLGSIPWKVNKPLLDVVIGLFNSGGSEKLGIPCPPLVITNLELDRRASKEEKYEAFRARMLAKRKRSEMYSLWCDALYKLSLANHFRDRIFWLPHNMDFRGRVYPCPPHLNHLGSDLYRSLLVFAHSRPLGPEGLNWLKIHLINLTGLKKRESVHDRLEYANNILPLIIESANTPFKEGAWWMMSEKPWQTLATCFEIRDALSYEGGHEMFQSHFPVHQDGSCNGLQHYAALGRDSAGAESVNLAPSDVPQDVYSCVAALVDRERENDAKNGVEIAKVLEGFVKRKVIKQTVMTTVYGVTRFGARLQIAKQLKDLEGFPQGHVWQGSQYLVYKTFESIREMFNSTREIQDWFTESARLIAGTRGENLEYITPLGLPVVQPYSKNSSRPILAKTSGVVSNNQKYDKFERPNVVKQKNAFPPNFIHSLDSTHMMLTSLNCQRAGITFVSVHDCYWTHPDTVDVMNRICREQFVALHSQPILEELSEFFISKYGFDESSEFDQYPQSVQTAMKKLNIILQSIPSKGDFELEKVLDSIYFFS